MKNYGDRGGCYPPSAFASVDNSLRDLHNSPYQLFNQQAYLLDFLLSFGLFLCTVSGYKQIFFLSDTPHKVENIYRAICLHILLFSFPFSSEIQLGWLRLETRLIDGLSSFPPRSQVIDQPRFPVNIPSNSIPSKLWYIARIFQIGSMLVSYEESVRGFEPISNGEIF